MLTEKSIKVYFVYSDLNGVIDEISQSILESASFPPIEGLDTIVANFTLKILLETDLLDRRLLLAASEILRYPSFKYSCK